MTFKNIISGARPKTLILAVSPVLIAAFAAPSKNPFLLLCILLSSMLIQAGTNYINDAIDFEKKADTSERLGFNRLSLSGISSQKVFRLGVLSFIFASFFAIPLIMKGSWPILLIGISGILAGYLYTGTRFALAYLGIAEIFVIFYFGIFAQLGTALLFSQSFNFEILVRGLQSGLLACGFLVLNNLRDFEQDKKACKLTPVVRYGTTFGYIELILCCLGPLFLEFFEVKTHSYFLFLLPISFHILWYGKAYIGKKEMNKLFAWQFLLIVCFTLIKIWVLHES